MPTQVVAVCSPMGGGGGGAKSGHRLWSASELPLEIEMVTNLAKKGG